MYPLPVIEESAAVIKTCEREVRVAGCHACDSETNPQLQITDKVDIRHKALFTDSPSGRNRWECPPLVVGPKPGITLISYTGHEEIPAVENVVGTAEKSDQSVSVLIASHSAFTRAQAVANAVVV